MAVRSERPSSLHPEGRARRVLGRIVQIVLPAALLVAAAFTLRHELRGLHWADVRGTLSSLPLSRVLLAVAGTFGGYLVLTLYDLMGLSYLGKPRPWGRLLPLSFVSFAFANNLGFAVLSGGSVRFRLFPSLGIGAVDIARVIAFTSFTTFLGQLELGGLAALYDPETTASLLHLSTDVVRVGAIVLSLIGPMYLAFVVLRPEGIRVRGFRLPAPKLPLATAQLLVACGDWVLNAFVLWALLPPGSHVSYAGILALFLAAQLVGSLSQVPGGLGVFDTLILAALTPGVPAAAVLSMLVVYRLIYFVGPFVLAAIMLAIHEAGERREALSRLARTARSTVGPVVPQVAAMGAFFAGGLLVLSGADPALTVQILHIESFPPLGVLEASHLLGSIVGVGLLVLARGLARRLDAAFVLAVFMLGAGVVLSVLHGRYLTQAAILLLLLLAFLPFRREFYRPAPAFSERFTLPWAAAVALVLAGAAWIGWFSHTHGAVRSQGFWRFALDAGEPRSLRALLAATATAVIFGVSQLLRPPPREPALPGEDDLERAVPIVNASPSPLAHLALAGDKALLFHESGDALLMFGVQGRVFVGLGDPLGSPAEAAELAWRLHDIADRHRGITCFFDVGPELRHLYLELGLSELALGEEALIVPGEFSLQAPAQRELREAVESRAATHRAEVLPGTDVGKVFPALLAIDDARPGAERRSFVTGPLDERYLSRGSLVLVRRGEAPVAFAALWQSGGTASVDVVRHLPGEEAQLDLLLVEAIEWARRQRCHSFSLGLSPFTELEGPELLPIWNRLGTGLFAHGEHFADTTELRRYQERFSPTFHRRFFAAPPALSLPAVLGAVARLVSPG